jgi:hypothetical protein
MNIYHIIEDGDDFCVKAKSMSEACKVSEDFYIKERLEETNPETICSQDIFVKEEREFYRNEILKSCNLIARL